MNGKLVFSTLAAVGLVYLAFYSEVAETAQAISDADIRFQGVGQPTVPAKGWLRLPIVFQMSNPNTTDIVIDYIAIDVVLAGQKALFIQIQKPITLKGLTNPLVKLNADTSMMKAAITLAKVLGDIANSNTPQTIGVQGFIRYNGIKHYVNDSIPLPIDWAKTVLQSIKL